MATSQVPPGAHGTGTRAPRFAAIAVVAVIVVVAGILVHARGGGGYPADVAAVCRGTEKSLHGFTGDYFNTVVFLSDARARGLAALHPDAGHQALQTEIIDAEAQLSAGARRAQQRADTYGMLYVRRDFTTVRALEGAQERRLQTLGVRGCAD